MKKWVWILLATIVAILIIFLFIRSNEDNWIKDSRGVWVKHGYPSDIPNEVKAQQDLIAKADKIFQDAKSSGKDLSAGPCLGKIDSDWVVDIVHNPRQDVDNLSQNQCIDYANGQVHHFVELDPNGEIIQIK
ncbi:hypothetical protein COT77_01760 [Candidatus Berkelbacteria bacterium CG10_big_fil_rev_8_21_14_0_10_41_12]|uniref:Uncharacterized protein n=1 Tax=Candidatus Berkelbacteria bacterium CG10_big_fil_rev_8_21_14_0_10_41_12 TaxID=1974513 RepID=A0A2M6WXB4_9BACT|nr:MAG: hypothetical protein COT77_01760 [Candidatus Berkelbacteria bacterium CG10_big_fil_rev_8_21_14_0_10_41_12]